MTDTLRENLGKALERELRELLRTKEAPHMDLAEACQSAARAALAAAQQPAPVDREALVEVIDAAITRWLQDGYDDPRNKPEAVADALLARGLRLPEDGETLAWAVIEDGIISPNLIDSEKESVQRWAEAWKGSMVRVAIRVVEEGDDGA